LSRHEFGSDTPGRILDTAEELFANHGIAATSLRQLTRTAGVNLAAVHYYFGSKEALLDAVIDRRATTVNRERIAELERRSRRADGEPSVEEILSAFILAGLEPNEALGERGKSLSRLLARIHAQTPDVVEALTRKHFGEVMQTFVEALQRALPEIPPEEVTHRFRFSVGSLLHVFSANFDLDSIPGHPVQIEDEISLTRQLLSFLAAGLRAPALTERSPATAKLRVAAR
jgi:AcrR family transcriptional regulator